MSFISTFDSVSRSAFGQLTQAQNHMLSLADEEMRPMLEAQMKMQKEQEMTQFITQMMKSLHEMTMSIVKNIGS